MTTHYDLLSPASQVANRRINMPYRGQRVVRLSPKFYPAALCTSGRAALHRKVEMEASRIYGFHWLDPFASSYHTPRS